MVFNNYALIIYIDALKKVPNKTYPTTPDGVIIRMKPQKGITKSHFVIICFIIIYLFLNHI